MFQGLGLEARREAARVFQPLRVRRGEVLYREGDPADGVYLVRQGLVWLHAEEGEGLTLSLLGPGDLFGEEALVGGLRRGLSAQALAYTELLFGERKEVEALRARFPEVNAFLLEALYKRLKAMEARFFELRFPVAQRLARLLLRLGEGEVLFSHQDLARMVGATRETVTKLLGEWALAGVLDLGYRRLEIKDREALARLAEAL
ncbi:cAMP-binding protein [Thermus oshimai JL-2]|uniref:cAMP-binding protein n=1 Tax=Thermus oshimai JL-2 TaxID=751945 RepID=K7QU62_THEOS|nr:Crp/Fnr family transcriptional regulator [Thermus oshimai]AFV75696.1 cAMP-binding protein [Thermus oshimai JL-2]